MARIDAASVTAGLRSVHGAHGNAEDPGAERPRSRYRALVQTRWVHREIEAPSAVVWELLTDLDAWSAWGPTVRGAELDDGTGELAVHKTGTVTTSVGFALPFEVTTFVPGRCWSWDVAGLPATDHTVEPLGPDRCRAGFGAPAIVAPYLLVCRLALARIDALARARIEGSRGVAS